MVGQFARSRGILHGLSALSKHFQSAAPGDRSESVELDQRGFDRYAIAGQTSLDFNLDAYGQLVDRTVLEAAVAVVNRDAANKWR